MTNCASDADEVQRAILSEVFHDISQPLTALACNLELSLSCDRTVADFVDRVQTALETVERIRQRMLLVHALNHATDSGEISRTTDWNNFIQELHDNMLPVFEAGSRSLVLEILSATGTVKVRRNSLMRALFYFFEYLLRYSPESSSTNVQVEAQEDATAALRIISQSSLPLGQLGKKSVEPFSCEIELAHRTFRAARGDFQFVSGNAYQNVWLATVPLA